MTAQTAPAAAPANLTFEEFLTAYDGIHAEWVDGQVLVMSPSTDRHSRVSRFLITAIQTYAEERRLGEVFIPAYPMWLGTHPSGREPDVLYVAREHSGRVNRTFLSGPADLVVEVVSPDSVRRDREEKFREYEQAGVPEYWLIDPDAETAEVYRFSPAIRRFEPVPLGDPPTIRSNALPGLRIPVEWLWRTEVPRASELLREWGLI